MAPNNVKDSPSFQKGIGLTGPLLKEEEKLEKLIAPQASDFKYELVIGNVIYFLFIHISGLYGAYVAFSAKWTTLLFYIIYYFIGAFAVTAGAHRLWSHNSYEAAIPLQVLLMLAHSTCCQHSVIWWVRKHRQHHLYSDTDGDPHNSTRGIFYSHVGWLLTRSHPEAVKRRKFVKTADLVNNPVLNFQKKYALLFIVGMAFVVPTVIPLLWGEKLYVSYYVNMFRLLVLYNLTWSINSLAHAWGSKPYDKNIYATQKTSMAWLTLGDGYHNFHHTFPWDYASSEFGNYSINPTKWLIDQFARIGWAKNMKTVPQAIIDKRAARTGDGTDLWGY